MKPNGEIIVLDKNELLSTVIKEGFVEYSDNKSLKFTYPGVEKGAILEYKYTVNSKGLFVGFNYYYEKHYHKYYGKLIIELPHILVENKIDWYYSAYNFSLDRPKSQNIQTIKESRKTQVPKFFANLPIFLRLFMKEV